MSDDFDWKAVAFAANDISTIANKVWLRKEMSLEEKDAINDRLMTISSQFGAGRRALALAESQRDLCRAAMRRMIKVTTSGPSRKGDDE